MARERPPENLHCRIATGLAPVPGVFMLLKAFADSSPAAREDRQESVLYKHSIADDRAIGADFSEATE